MSKSNPTLWERLNEEHRNLIIEDSVKYPNTWTPIIEKLKNNWGSTIMNVGEAMQIHFLINPKAFDLTIYMNFFDNN